MATARTMVGTLRRGGALLLCGTALQGAALVAAIAAVHAAGLPANAQPQGGKVVAGKASISQTATVTTVDQSSALAAVNWQSFNVGSAETVIFQQPSASAITLNRVVGPDPSLIAGHIVANGNIVLVNGSGVVFEKGSQVNVNSLVVSTADIANKDFTGGKLNFTIPGKPNATIVNNGSITVKQSGLAALVAPAVANNGVINARMGTVVLAGATTSTVDLYGDGLLAIDVTGQVRQVPVGANGQKVAALVTNTGTILAQGGTIALTAAAADGIVTNLVTAGGRISADGGQGTGGSIVLNGVGGSLVVEGDLSARGSTGGSVQALADGGVTVASTATIDVSGARGGGKVALGTTLARAAAGSSLTTAPVAPTVTVAPGAVVKANATRKGNGGTITVLSSNGTTMAGRLSARGGAQGGNGGLVEVSAKTGLALTGTVDTMAPRGHTGTLLLDPADVVIAVNDPGGTASFVSVASIDSATTNVSIQADNSITVADSITTGNTTTRIDLALTTTTGAITINPTNASGGGPLSITVNGDASLQACSAIALNGGLTAQAVAGLGGGTVNLNAGGGITQAAGAGITAAVLTGSANGMATLTGTNRVASLGAFTASGAGAGLTLYDNVPLTLTGDIAAPSIQIGATGSLTVASGVTITTGFQPLPATPTTQPPPDSNGSTGLNLAILNGPGTIDLGPNLTIRGTSGAPRQTVRLALTDGGVIRFGNLNAPGADLLLHVGSGVASSASGTTINVYSLSVFYQTGHTGPVNLAGTVGGQSGRNAASLSRIAQSPTAPAAFAPTTDATSAPDPRFQVNQCVIDAAICTTTTATSLTTLSTLSLVPQAQVDAMSGQDSASNEDSSSSSGLHQVRLLVFMPGEGLDDPDLLLPFISDRDS